MTPIEIIIEIVNFLLLCFWTYLVWNHFFARKFPGYKHTANDVYFWEYKYINKHEYNEELTEAECRDLMEKCAKYLNAKPVSLFYTDEKFYTNKMPLFRNQVAGFYNPNNQTIMLWKGGNNISTVLHEYAHAITFMELNTINKLVYSCQYLAQADRHYHAEIFMGIYRDLLINVGKFSQEYIDNSIKKRGIKYESATIANIFF